MKSHILLSFIMLFIFSSCQKSFEERIMEETKYYTENNCPKPVEPGSHLDSLTYSPTTRTITHWFTLSGEKEDTAFLNNFEKKSEMFRTNTLRTLINDTNWEGCKKEGVNFCYVYRLSLTGEEFIRFLFTPDEYNHHNK